MSSANYKQVCVIGAGQSGLAVAKALTERSIPFDCFEKGSKPGGMWRYLNDSGLSVAYETLETNTSKQRTGFSDLKMPRHFPDHLHHTQMLQYLEMYADRFQLRTSIRCGTEVKRVYPSPNGWTVSLSDGEEKDYHAVIVANGHNWAPRWAKFPGRFDGQLLHSRSFRNNASFKGQRVLIIGLGLSGADIACQCARVAIKTVVSTRSGAHVVPKYVLGRPADHWATPITELLPVPVRDTLFRLLLWLERGSQAAYGLPAPQHSILDVQPTMSSELLPLIKSGDIAVKPNVALLEGKAAHFEDGTKEDFDVIIYATGYQVCFPFLPDHLVPFSSDEAPSLYLRVVEPHNPNLFFVGLFASLGSAIPIVELQAKWIALLLDGSCVLPSRHGMCRQITRHRLQMDRRFLHSARYHLQVEFFSYARELRRAIREGRRPKTGGLQRVRNSR